MGTTKIINILKSDSFDDIFEEFKKAQAEEVIFILPKNSRVGRNESHFVSLASEAQASQKKITFMTADESAKNFAQKYNFRLLANQDEDDRPDAEVESSPDFETSESNIANGHDEDSLIEEDPELSEIAEEEQKENAGIIEKEEDEETPISPDADTGEDLSEDLIEEKEGEEYADLAMARTPAARKKSGASGKNLKKLENIWRGSPSGSGKNFWSGVNARGFAGIKKEKLNNRAGLIFTVSGFVLLAIILYFFLGSAKIVIKPQKEKLDLSINVSVSSNYPQINYDSNSIPGQFLSYSAEITKDFTSSGQKEVARKARGEITVFNNFNSEPQILVATTRFQSSDGLIFRTPRAITIPGAKLVSGKLVPGSITLEVLADKPGQEYNINADKFTIPGFKGTPRFEGFYAESSQPTSGGIIGLSKIVTEKDFNTAKETVTKEASDEALSKLKTKTNNLKIIEPLDNQVTSLKSTAEVDDAVEGFAIATTAEAKTIAFNEDDLLKLVENSISKKGELTLLKETVNFDYSESKLDLAKKVLTFRLSVQGEAARKVDEQKITKSLLGMKQGKIKDYFLGIPEIESARVILTPFWVRSVPKNINDVELKLVY